MAPTANPKKSFYIFNSYFYRTLVDFDYAKVKNWTKDVNIFEYDYILIPINHGYAKGVDSLEFQDFSSSNSTLSLLANRYHWRLAVVCNCKNLSKKTKLAPSEAPLIILFDSLKKNRTICSEIKKYDR